MPETARPLTQPVAAASSTKPASLRRTKARRRSGAWIQARPVRRPSPPRDGLALAGEVGRAAALAPAAGEGLRVLRWLTPCS
ncbi:hypothetical protein GCM10007886_45070 [Methylobacterium gregans]|nr:hypothetical protein GCM10007886_45070 [Methylobacterium gregans]